MRWSSRWRAWEQPRSSPPQTSLRYLSPALPAPLALQEPTERPDRPSPGPGDPEALRGPQVRLERREPTAPTGATERTGSAVRLSLVRAARPDLSDLSDLRDRRGLKAVLVTPVWRDLSDPRVLPDLLAPLARRDRSPNP